MILLVPLAFLGALAGALFVGVPWWAPASLLAGGAAGLAGARRAWQATLAVTLLAAAAGVLRATVAPGGPATPFAQRVAAGEVTALRGAVVDDPVSHERAQQARFRVDAVRDGDGRWSVAAGYAQVTARPVPALEYGDLLELAGKVKTPEASAPAGYAAFLRRQGVDAVVGFPAMRRLGTDSARDSWQGALLAVRAHLAGTVERAMPEPEAALVQGILLGRHATIPHDLTDAMNRSGTSHMVAVSGYNVSVVVGVATTAVARLAGRGRRRGPVVTVVGSGALWAFVALAGASGSVLRAAAMAQLALAGRALGRSGTAGSLLLWGSAALAAWQPGVLQDTGWQLSFLGTAGLVWLSPPLERRLRRLPRVVREGLAATLAAEVCVLPVVASSFGRASLVAPLSNTLGLPLIPPIMAGGAALVASATLLPGLAPLAATLTWAPATALIHLVRWCAGLPGAAIALPEWNGGVVIGYLAGLVALCALAEYRAATSPPPGSAGGTGAVAAAGGQGHLLAGAAVVVLLALAGAGWAQAVPSTASITSPGSAPALVIEIPPVPDGALALVQAADGTRVLLNGGPATGGATALLGKYLRPWDRTVDVAVLADPRETYALGLAAVLERERVGLLVDAVGGYPSAAYRQVREVAQRRGVRRLQPDPGAEIAVGSTLRLELLPPAPYEPAARASAGAGEVAPGTGHERAPAPLAVRVRWGDVGVLFPGDGGATHTLALVYGPAALQSAVVVVPERALREPAIASLLRAAAPEVVVAQGAPPKEGSAGPPAPALAGAAPAATWHRTATEGAVRLEVDGDGYRVAGDASPLRASQSR